MSIALLPLGGIVLSAPALLALGISTSPHCVLMCGPLAQALHRPQSSSLARSALMLNLGRISSYAALGALAGVGGGGLLLLAGRWNAEPLIRIGAAVFLLLFGACQWHATRPRRACCVPRVAPRDLPAYWKGLAWGMLPCPLFYAVLGLAGLTGSAVQGALLALAFGVGTTPALISAAALTQTLVLRNLQNLRRASAAMLVIAGLWIAATTWPFTAGWSAFCHALT